MIGAAMLSNGGSIILFFDTDSYMYLEVVVNFKVSINYNSCCC